MDEANARGGRLTMRPATPDDATALADIFLTAMLRAVPGLPLAHSRDEIIAWIGTRAIPTYHVTVAVVDEQPAGFVTTARNWIHQLFVSPAFQRMGVGSALIAPILLAAAGPVRLWTFQRNIGAREFYERHHFSEELFTDGSANEERTPDILYVWRPPTVFKPSGQFDPS